MTAYNKRINGTVILSMLLLSMYYGCQAQHEADTVISRYRQYLFRTVHPAPADIATWISSLHEQQWADINYLDTERANWQTSRHLERIRQLAIAWQSPGSPYYHDNAVKQVIDSALDHWLTRRYKNSNWWHNEIGVPQYMRDIMVLLYDTLTPDRFRQSLEVLRQHRVLGNGNGANLIWSADLGFHYGALTHDNQMMERCRDLMVNEIVISTGEGLQPDYSFHQHGSRLQTYQYGKAFLWENVHLAWQLRGTPWAFPAEKIAVLKNFIFEGWQWMARGINTVPGTIDRSVTREHSLHSADLRALIPLLQDLCPEDVAALRELEERQNGEGSLTGLRHYPYSDFTAYHRPDFSFFLKTISDRTLPSESANNENIKGNLLNNGDAYIVRDGQEYFDLMPVWDWQLLPGVTIFKEGSIPGRLSFAGNVSNGTSGLTAMDYALKDSSQQKGISMHKVWAMHGDRIVCLMSDMRTANVQGDVVTALDQCRWQDEIAVNRPRHVVKEEGIQELRGVKWIHHASTAYIPLKKANIRLHAREATGTWRSINKSQSERTVTEKVFMPVMHHGKSLEGASAGYIIAYSPTVSKTRRLARKHDWEVLRNDKDCQAVSFKDGMLMAAFFSPSRVKTAYHDLAVDKPCLVLFDGNKLYISDALHTGEVVNVRWNGKVMNIEMPADGMPKAVTGH